MSSFFDEVAQYSQQLPRAAMATCPALRCAAERYDVLSPHSEHAFTVERLSAAQAHSREVCLALPPGVEEVILVTMQGLARYGSVQAAAEAHMWWVDRSIRHSSHGATAATTACCVRLLELSAENLFLFSSADSNGLAAGSVAGARRLRVPAHLFALQLCRLVELRGVQASASVARLVSEVDVRSCLRWAQTDVNAFLVSLVSPLRAVRVPTVSLSAVTLLQRFHASLRVLYLSRRSTAIFHDPHCLLPFEDEELEEEEVRTASTIPTAPGTAHVPVKRVPAAAPAAAPPAKKRVTGVAQPTPASASAATPPKKPRRRTRVLKLPAGATPVLEELHICSSVRRLLPNWVGKCTRLRRVTFNACHYTSLASLRRAVQLSEVVMEGCNHFTAFDFFCAFPQLERLTIKNCSQLRSVAWLPQLSGALRHLCVHHLTPAPLAVGVESADVGVGLDCLEVLNLSIPTLQDLRPLIRYASRTLRELTLFTCLHLDGFAEWAPLPRLERVVMVGNRPMRSVEWLRASPLLVELRATQCTQLSSLRGVEALTQLRVLDVTGATQLVDVSDVRACRQLRYVDVSQCVALTTVDAFMQLPLLQHALLRNCTRLPRSFEWLAGCPNLIELVTPNSLWVGAAAEALLQLNRSGDVHLH